MRILGSKLGTVVILAVVAVLMYIAFVTLPSANCAALARGVGQNYYFHPVDGCYLQNAAGDFYRVDAVTINQP